MADLIPAHKNEEGFVVEATSGCCGASLVYFDRHEGLYVRWAGWSQSHPRYYPLRCSLCNEEMMTGGDDD